MSPLRGPAGQSLELQPRAPADAPRHGLEEGLLAFEHRGEAKQIERIAEAQILDELRRVRFDSSSPEWQELKGALWEYGYAVLQAWGRATDVARLLDEYEVPATSLTLEITETTVIGESQRSIEVVQSLVKLGVKLSCDDFGTGYSSLSRLRRLPIDEIKVDRSLVAHMADDDTDRAITRSVLSLGRGLGLTTVAEGVEDRSGWDILLAYGCDQAQGFLVSRPLAPEKFREWMSNQPSSSRPVLSEESAMDCFQGPSRVQKTFGIEDNKQKADIPERSASTGTVDGDDLAV